MLGTGETAILKNTCLSQIIPKENIFINKMRFTIQISFLNNSPMIQQEQIVLEPAMRNTSAFIFLYTLKIKTKSRC